MPKATAPDFDAILSTISQTGGVRSKVNLILDLLPADQRAKAERALREPNISDARIAKALSKMGTGETCGDGAVATWRKNHGVRT